MNDDYDYDYEYNSDDNLYIDGEDKKPKLIIIVVSIVILLILILIFLFACSREKTKSDNNYLNKISVSNGNINPTFNKENLNYNVLVNADFVTINCSSESTKATTEGCNKRIYLSEDCVEHIIKVTSESKAIKEYKLNICKQTDEAPVIKNVKVLPDGYTKGKVTVTVEASSTITLNDKAYSFDGGSTWQSSNSFAVEENKTLEIKVRDKNNSESAIFLKEIKNIDKTNPSINIKGSVDSGISTTSDVVLTATVSPKSTISGYKYQWYKGNDSIKGATKSTYTATSSGDYKVKVTTGSGNSATSKIFKVNKKQSVSTSYKIDIKVTKNTSNWTKDSVTLTVKATATNGLAREAYSFDGGKTFSKSNTKSFLSNQTVTIVVKDKKGNKETYKEHIANIDKTIPTVTITGNNTVGSKLTAKVTPTTTASQYKYQWYFNTNIINGATSSSYTATKAGNYEVKVTTGAGASKTSSKFTVKEPVKGTVTLDSSVGTGTLTNKDVVLTATATNATVKSYKWYKNNNFIKSTSSNKYTINTTTNGTYKVIAEFTNGKTATSSPVVVNVDKTAPTLNIDARLNSYSGTKYTGGTWTNKTIYITVSATDNQMMEDLGFQYLKGDTIWYSHATMAWGSKTISGSKGEAKIYFDVNRNYPFTVRAVDKAGNVTIKKLETKIDKTPPDTPFFIEKQVFDYNIACLANKQETFIETKTKEFRYCIGTTSNYNLQIRASDEGGSGIAGCQYVLKRNDTGKTYGNFGDFEVDTRTLNVTGYNTVTWANDSGPGVPINDKSIIYMRRCYDNAGNYSNALYAALVYYKKK